jgi:hypothetical protein
MPPLFVIDALAVLFLWSMVGRPLVSLLDEVLDGLPALALRPAVVAGLAYWTLSTHSLWWTACAVGGAVGACLAAIGALQHVADQPPATLVTRRSAPRRPFTH